MKTIAINTSTPLNGEDSSHKTLKLNGCAAIESFVSKANEEGSIFLQENKVVFVRRGSFKIRYAKKEYVIGKSQMAFLRKDILIEYKTEAPPDCSERIEYIFFSLHCELIKEFTKLVVLSIEANDEPLPIAVNTIDSALTKYIDSLELYFLEPEKVEAHLVKIKLLELLFYLIKTDSQILEQLLHLKENHRSNITATVEENILNSLSLNQLAVLCGRSLSSFRRDFLAIYNMPPSQWIRKKKLGKAQELLLSTTMTVTDVCYATGFENIAHFSRLFKSQFGYSPSAFRLNVLVA